MRQSPEEEKNVDVLYERLDAGRLPKFLFGGFWIRTAAYLFDLLVIRALTSLVLNLVVYRLFGVGISESAAVELLRLVVFLTYFFATTYFMEGQTLGKVLFRLRVIPLNGFGSKLSTMLVREVAGKTVFYYFPIVAVLLVFTHKRQHVVDLLADTSVINEGKLTEYSWLADHLN